jgi:hypothetical protein
MEFYDAVYRAVGIRDMTIDGLSLKMGHTSTYITSSKSRGSLPKVDTAVKILDACDFALCAIPKESIPDCAIVIERPEE